MLVRLRYDHRLYILRVATGRHKGGNLLVHLRLICRGRFDQTGWIRHDGHIVGVVAQIQSGQIAKRNLLKCRLAIGTDRTQNECLLRLHIGIGQNDCVASFHIWRHDDLKCDFWGGGEKNGLFFVESVRQRLTCEYFGAFDT